MSLYLKGIRARVNTIRVGAVEEFADLARQLTTPKTVVDAPGEIKAPPFVPPPSELPAKAIKLAEDNSGDFVMVDFPIGPAGTPKVVVRNFTTRQAMDDEFFKAAAEIAIPGKSGHHYTAEFDKTGDHWKNHHEPETDFGFDLLKIAIRASAPKPDIAAPKPSVSASTPSVSRSVTINKSSNTGVFWILGGITAGLGLLWYKDKKKRSVA